MRVLIRIVNPENDVTDRGFSMNVGGNSGSVMMPSSKVSTENTEKFIELIHQHPSVFDTLCPKHKFWLDFLLYPPAKCPQTAIHYSQTLVDYFDLSQKAAAGFIMPTSSSFLLNPTFILR